MKTWAQVKKDLLKDPDFAKEVKKLEPVYQIISQLIKARIEQNLTQEDLAKKIGTKQGNISRLEKGNANPSLQFLKKVAKGLGKELSISFKTPRRADTV
ncbi:MAG: helix-turn-helix transcriptional regulator [Syntrophorhabdaceae bacterium]|nr:helix-turn-helix transcriptional regulator [Syntrophorhabdaceae bacterium]